MPRAGYLILLALLLAAAAAGVVLWSKFFTQHLQSPTPSAPTTQTTQTVTSPQLVRPMTDAVAGGGFAATFSGNGSEVWKLAAGHRVDRLGLNGGDAVLARLVSGTPLDHKEIVDGLYTELPLEFAQSANGKKIEVGIVVKSGQANPSGEFSIIYSTRHAGNSGWRTLPLSANFEVRAFIYDVPNRAEGYNAKPVIAVRGDQLGKGRTVELIGIYAKILQATVSSTPTGVKYRAAFSPGSTVEWIVHAGHTLAPAQDAVTHESLGLLTSSIALDQTSSDLAAQGAATLVPKSVAQLLNGKAVHLVIRARTPPSNPNGKLYIMFSTQQGSRTGWRAIPLTASMESYSVVHTIPKIDEGYDGPFLVVLSTETNSTPKSVEIESIEIVSTVMK